MPLSHFYLQGIAFDIDKPDISLKMWELFVFLVTIIDKLDEVDPSTNKKIIGSILVFLPGINEIEEAKRRLETYYKNERIHEQNPDGTAKSKWQIVPLHSSLPNDEQAAVFQPSTEDHRKIILSTNIAESSVTVPETYYGESETDINSKKRNNLCNLICSYRLLSNQSNDCRSCYQIHEFKARMGVTRKLRPKSR